MTPTEMEIRVAKALFRVEYENILHYQWEQEASSPELLAYWLKCARAAIQAMKDDPGHDVTAAVCKPGDDRTEAVRMWQAMINAASPTTDGDK